MPEEPKSYRSRFIDSAEAVSYDEGEYAPTTYPALVWRLEQEFLAKSVAKLSREVPSISYLDFACGTGRILAFLEPLVESATGVEISSAMLERARAKVVSATLVHGDLTVDASLVTEKFDLITAFRFVLNAEPELRVSAMRRLATLLRDEHSLLVFNNHINLWSYKLATWPVQKILRRNAEGNFLTFRQVQGLAADCGLVVEMAYGCGYLSRRALQLMPHDKLYGVEHRLSGIRLLRGFGADQIYVARRQPG